MAFSPTMNSPNGVVLVGGEREVDFYRNPTELFRWINYRRWEGAENRAKTCPEEVRTWIVSTDQNTSQIQWRHLPLHLCCMQSQIPMSLIETLIKIYPEATESQDHDGMTPLHLACFKGGINEEVAKFLLCYYPGAACMVDKNNRTPLDLLQLSITSGTMVSNEVKQVSFLLNRTQNFLTEIKASVRDEEVKRLNEVHASVSNERVASQQVITRLESEISKSKEKIESLEAELESKEELEGDLELRMVNLQKKINEGSEEKKQLQKEIDDLNDKLQKHSFTLSGKSNEAEQVRKLMQEEIDSLHQKLDDAHSEIATSKSMVEALEQQLKSKFSGEYSNSSKVRELEIALSEAAVSRNVQETEHNNKISELQRDLSKAKDTVEELTKFNLSLQSKIKDLSDSLSKVLASQNIMSAEQDRLVESCRKYEADVETLMDGERSRLADIMERQRKTMNEFLEDQKRVLLNGSETAAQLQDVMRSERERCLSTIENMKHEFEQAQAMERELKMQESARRASSKVPLPHLSIPSPGGGGQTPSGGNTASMGSPRPATNFRVLPTTPRQAPSPNAYTPRQSSSPAVVGHGNLNRMMEQRRALDFDDRSSELSRGDSSSTSTTGRVFGPGMSFDQQWSGGGGGSQQSQPPPPPPRRSLQSGVGPNGQPTTPRSSSVGAGPSVTPRGSMLQHPTPRSVPVVGPKSILQSPRRSTQQVTVNSGSKLQNPRPSNDSSDMQTSLRMKPSLFDQRQDLTSPRRSMTGRQVGFTEKQNH